MFEHLRTTTEFRELPRKPSDQVVLTIAEIRDFLKVIDFITDSWGSASLAIMKLALAGDELWRFDGAYRKMIEETASWASRIAAGLRPDWVTNEFRGIREILRINNKACSEKDELKRCSDLRSHRCRLLAFIEEEEATYHATGIRSAPAETELTNEGNKSIATVQHVRQEMPAIGAVGAKQPSADVANEFHAPPSDVPEANGYVESPADSAAYVPFIEIETEEATAESGLTRRQIVSILENYEQCQVRWTRPKSRAGKPKKNRRNVHFIDWRRYLKRIKSLGKKDFPPLSEEELERRKESIRASGAR